MAALGDAFISVRADLKPFTKDLAKELKVILNAAEKEVKARGQAMGKALSESMAEGARKEAHKITDTVSKEVEKHKIVIKTEVDRKGAKASAEEALGDVDKVAKGFLTSLSKRFSDTFASLGRFISGTLSSATQGTLKTPIVGPLVAAGIAALVSILLAFIPAAIQATQAAGGLIASLTLLPAAGAAAALSIGVLSLAFDGFDKAISAALSGDIEKFNKSLEGLTPSAKAAAKALQPGLTFIRNLVQTGVFDQLVKPFQALSNVLRSPRVAQGLDLIARTLGDVIAQVVRFATSAEGLSVFDEVVTAIFRTVVALQPAMKPLLQAIGAIIKAGAAVLPAVAKVFATLAINLSNLILKAEKSGALEKFFNNIVKVIENSGPIIQRLLEDLVGFLDWAVSNPDAITGLADAFFMLANAFGKAFSDPQVIASFQAIVGILVSIPPSAWEAIALGIVRMALALGVIGATIIWIDAQVSDKLLKMQHFLENFADFVGGFPIVLLKKVSGWRGAGVALMNAFFEGIRASVQNIGGVADAIVSRIKHSINVAIGAINSRLGTVFTVLGVKGPSIPMLAKGGIIDEPTIAMMGEKGAEAVVPLTNPTAAAAVLMKSGLMNMMAPVVNVFLGSEQLEARMYQVVAQNNVRQARSLSNTPRIA